MTPCCRLAAFVLAAAPLCASAQARSMAQDSSLDNLVHAAGTALTPMGTLGRVRIAGAGPRHMVLIAGMGFGDDTWEEFAQGYRDRYTMHLVTLPGFGGTLRGR